MHLHITNSHMATIKYHLHYPLFKACTGEAVSFDVIFVYSLNPGKFPDRFSYERPGYEARVISVLSYKASSTVDREIFMDVKNNSRKNLKFSRFRLILEIFRCKLFYSCVKFLQLVSTAKLF